MHHKPNIFQNTKHQDQKGRQPSAKDFTLSTFTKMKIILNGGTKIGSLVGSIFLTRAKYYRTASSNQLFLFKKIIIIHSPKWITLFGPEGILLILWQLMYSI